MNHLKEITFKTFYGDIMTLLNIRFILHPESNKSKPSSSYCDKWPHYSTNSITNLSSIRKIHQPTPCEQPR